MKKIFLYPLAFLFCAFTCGKIETGVLTLTRIEVRNIDNSGAEPVVAADGAAIPAKAYMIGVQWHGDVNYNGDNYTYPDRYDNPKRWADDPYVLADRYTYNIYTVGPFNADYPDGANVTPLFRTEKTYLPRNVDVGFVLFGNPDPGFHSFTVVYTGDGQTIEATTPAVELK